MHTIIEKSTNEEDGDISKFLTHVPNIHKTIQDKKEIREIKEKARKPNEYKNTIITIAHRMCNNNSASGQRQGPKRKTVW